MEENVNNIINDNENKMNKNKMNRNNKFKELVKENIGFFNERVLKKAIVLIFVMILLSAGFYYFFKSDSSTAIEIVTSFMESVDGLFDGEEIKVGTLIGNNIWAGFMAIMLGCIPFLFVTIFSLIVNVVLIGAVLSVSATSFSTPMMILCGLVPHGIFEIPAFCISMALSIELCLFLTKKIFKKDDRKFSYVIKNIGITFIDIVVPLFIIAGFVETYLTPLLMDLVIK